MKTRISRFQYFALITNLIYAKAIGFTSGVVTRKVGADNWTAMLIGFIFGMGALLLITYEASKFQGKNIIQYVNERVGKAPARLLGIGLSVCFGMAFITSVNTVGIHLKEYLLTETPYIVMLIIYVILCLYGVYLGIEVVIRFSFFAFIMILLLNASMVLGIVNEFEFTNLQPILDKGLLENLKGSVYVFSDIAMAILAVGFIFPMLKEGKRNISMSFWAMSVAAGLVLTWPITETGVMGAEVMKQFVVVCMQQARSAQITQYMPRYEMIMVILFIWGAFVQSAVMYHCCFYSLKQSINFKKDWFFYIATAVILTAASYYYGHDHNYFTKLLTTPWPQIAAAVSIGLPLLILPLVVMKRKETV